MCKRNIFFLLTFLILAMPASEAAGQTLGVYGGAGISLDVFRFDRLYGNHAPSVATGPLGLVGLRYHTRQNFDILLDGSIGITKIKLPLPANVNGSMGYEQLQSLVMVGSGLNIQMEKANLMPFIQIGAAFFDYWGITIETNGQGSMHMLGDENTNRWTVACGAGIDYQFKLFLSSGINLRFLYTPLDVFKEPVEIGMGQGNPALQLQGKLLQAQLTYRVYLPLAKWKDRYD